MLRRIHTWCCNLWNGTGLDDPDNLGHLGHFFSGSSGCHPQTKVSGCDLELHVLSSIGESLYLKKVGIENLPLKKLATIYSVVIGSQ